MIITLILQFLVGLLNVVFSILGHVTELPFGAETVFVNLFGWIHGILYELPFLSIVWNCILIFYSFKLTIMALKLVRIIR